MGSEGRRQFDPKDYEKVKSISYNSNGSVIKVKNMDTEECFVQKEVPLNEENTAGWFKKEVEILDRLPSNEYIVKFYASYLSEQKKKGYILLELCDMNLEELLEKLRDPVTSKWGVSDWSQVRPLALQISRGLQHLHSQEPEAIVHRDLKPENVLVNAPKGQGVPPTRITIQEMQQVRVKLTDFGLSKCLLKDGSQSASLVGTKKFFSPEQIKALKDENRKRGEKYRSSSPTSSDIFSLGVIFFWMRFGEVPYYPQQLENAFDCKDHDQWKTHDLSPADLKLKDLCIKMLQFKIKDSQGRLMRPSIDDIIEDPCLQETSK